MISNKFCLLKEQSDGKYFLRYYWWSIEWIQFMDLDLENALYDLANQWYQPKCSSKEWTFFIKKNILKRDPK